MYYLAYSNIQQYTITVFCFTIYFVYFCSVSLPARFVMKLNSPMPLSLAKCREIAQLTQMEFFDETSASPLIQLIVKNASGNKLDSANSRGLFVVSLIQ